MFLVIDQQSSSFFYIGENKMQTYTRVIVENQKKHTFRPSVPSPRPITVLDIMVFFILIILTIIGIVRLLGGY